jgi:prepilin-type processing-associated H-X9-DG protein
MNRSPSWRGVVEILIIAVIGFFVLGELSFVLPPCFSTMCICRSDRVLAAHNLKVIGLAMHNYHDTYGSFPPPAIYSKEGEPLLSWRVLLLPFLEQEELYSQFQLDEPWDSANNLSLLAKMPRYYAPATGKPPQEPFATYYQVFVGPGAAFEGKKAFSFASFTDGTSNTILVIEAAKPVAWTKPEDLPFAPGQLLPKLGGLSKFGAANAAYVDGSVHYIPRDTDEKILRALITRNGGEVVDADNLP